MDNQHLYDEAMAKLAEAQTRQHDIINSNIELQRLQFAISTTIHYADLSSLKVQYKNLVLSLNDKIKERDDKLNEAISKALELFDDEICKIAQGQNSLGLQATGQIYSYMALQNIRIQYSLDVKTKLSKLMVKAKNMKDVLAHLKMFD